MDKDEESSKRNTAKSKRKNPKSVMKKVFTEFASNTSIHGVQYFPKKSFTKAERIFWIITFIISIILCSILIKNVYVKWKTSPVIITVSEKLVSVGEIPFPSVTICPQIKNKATVYNFTHELDKFKNHHFQTFDAISKFSDVTILCDFPSEDLDIPINKLKTNASIIKLINEVSPNSTDFLLHCIYKDSEVKCEDMFKKVYTAEGLCYNINGLAAAEMFRDNIQSEYAYSDRNEVAKGWSSEKGYDGTEKNAFPLQGRENGASPDLQVLLGYNQDDVDGLCNGMNSGFKIYIQHPTDHPQSSLYYYAALDGQVSSMAVTADIMASDSSLEGYSVDTRQCYFQKERELRFFKTYTASNCRLECLSNYTYKECGCVGYYMPHDNSSEICAAGKQECMGTAQIALAERELQIKINKTGDGCQCLAACNSVEYSAEILKTKFNFKSFIKNVIATENKVISGFINNIPMKFSKMDIYFKKPQFLSMKRSELFGLTDFLANIGGLLGLFCGFSFLSLMEIFYFSTIRLGCAFKRNSKK